MPRRRPAHIHVIFLSASSCAVPSLPKMSAGGQDDSAASFIGALISLTSHSNMRYQGVLSNIDAAQATLALEKGTCPKC